VSDRSETSDTVIAEDTASWRQTYDANARLYTLISAGFHLTGVARQRRRMIDALRLQEGDTVIDLCCGSGQNFAELRRRIGPSGRLIGVDISRNMLSIARELIDKNGWENVELIEADVADYDPPPTMRAAISTFGLDIVPGAERIVEDFAHKMPEGTRLGLLGSQEPENWPDWLVRLGIWINKPCDIERKHLSIRPDKAAARALEEERRKNFWFGIFYWSVCTNTGHGRKLEQGPMQ
jgi:demethylmenaquinone methyltransferase/2-methoxy-6-polyprenyl-1,4-benzoquinol methylase